MGKRVGLLASTMAAAFLGFAILLPEAEALERGAAKAEKVIVLKGARKLLLMRDGEVMKTYRVALGRSPEGPKLRRGDGRTPEGNYVLDWRNPGSRFHRSIHISYPNPADLERARKFGVPPGGDIMIHGLPKGAEAVGADHVKWDWTEGCIAVSNPEMNEIWDSVADGTPIEIRP